MNIKRAQEILNSKGIIDVTYNGKPIWIKDVDINNKTVNIEGIDNEVLATVVNVNELNEVNKIR